MRRAGALSALALVAAACTATPAATPPDTAVAASRPSVVRASTGRLPVVTLPRLDGGAPVRLGDVRGPAVVNVWASWCAPCIRELPTLQALHADAGARLRVLGIVTDDSAGSARDAARHLGVGYPSLLDADGVVRRALGIPGPPVTLFVDRNGRVVHRVVGPLPALSKLTDLVAARLGVQL